MGCWLSYFLWAADVWSIRYAYELRLYHVSLVSLNSVRKDDDLPLKVQSYPRLPECLDICMDPRLVVEIALDSMVRGLAIPPLLQGRRRKKHAINRIDGNLCETFETWDLVLLGSNIQYLWGWKSNEEEDGQIRPVFMHPKSCVSCHSFYWGDVALIHQWVDEAG